MINKAVGVTMSHCDIIWINFWQSQTFFLLVKIGLCISANALDDYLAHHD